MGRARDRPRRRGRSSTTAACSPAAANGATRACSTSCSDAPSGHAPTTTPTKGHDMLTAADVTGLLALPPSPLKADGEHLTEADSLDLDEADPPRRADDRRRCVRDRSVRHDRRMRDAPVGREGRALRGGHRHGRRVGCRCGAGPPRSARARSSVRCARRRTSARPPRSSACRCGRRRRWRTRWASSPTWARPSPTSR